MNNEKSEFSKIKSLKLEGKFQEALTLLEEYMIFISKQYGKNSKKFLSSTKELCEITNLLSISLYEQGESQLGLTYLLKSEDIFKNHKEVYATSLSNIGCYYILLEEYDKSLSYLYKCLNICSFNGYKNIAREVYLNISTVYSKLNLYEKSIEQCMNCITLVQEDIINKTNKGKFTKLEEKDEELSYEEKIYNDYNLLILAYRNLAVQYDNLNKLSKALLYYEISNSLLNEASKIPGLEEYFQSNLLIKGNEINEEYKYQLITNIKKIGIGQFKKENFPKQLKDNYMSLVNEVYEIYKNICEEEKVSKDKNEVEKNENDESNRKSNQDKSN